MEFAVHDFKIHYRKLRDNTAAVRIATIRATSAAEARVKWRHDARSRGNTVVSVTLRGE